MPNNSKGLREKISRRKIEVAVVGLGYVGLPLAVEFAERGIKVVGIEIDKGRLKHISGGHSYISDVTDGQLKKVLRRGTFKATRDFTALSASDVVLICVPTPLKRKVLPDISYIKNAVKSAARYIKKGALVVLESTTYPGTTEEEILPIFERRALKHGRDFLLCFSPERIDPGNKKFPVHRIPKIVGGVSREATRVACLFYGLIIKKVLPVSSPRAAETVKLLENTFRLINIGLVDELSMMAHKMKIDIWEVIQAASSKPFGFMPFYPGPGVGGHCIPKDPLYLHWKAKSFGFHSRFIRLASDVINTMPGYVVKRVQGALLKNKGIVLRKARILVVGVTYKKDVRDLRKSPAIDIIGILRKERVRVDYSDPLIPFLKIGGINLKSVPLSQTQIAGYDCLLITCGHSTVDYQYLKKHAKLIFDTRNVYKAGSLGNVIKL